MYLESLLLNNFRNYGRQELVFHPRINIFCGKNAQGKTNLLEAIYYLAVSRSFRTNQESEMLRFGSDYFYLKGSFLIKEECCQAEIGYRQPHLLQIKLNGKPVKRIDYIYRHPVVTFTPDDLFLIKEGPSVRRRFIDMEGSRLKPLYYRRLRDYYRVLRQRNRILKEKSGSRSFDYSIMEPWDKALVETGSWILKERVLLLQALELRAQSYFTILTGRSENLSLRYLSTIHFDEDLLELVESTFQEQLSAARSSELRKGSTQVGPHLDDFAVLINGCDARKFGSQGQQRSAVLALKMGEVDLFNSAGCERTILLLDDVFSEFDGERRRQLIDFLINREDQTFITTAVPLADVEKESFKESYTFSVCRGEITID